MKKMIEFYILIINEILIFLTLSINSFKQKVFTLLEFSLITILYVYFFFTKSVLSNSYIPILARASPSSSTINTSNTKFTQKN
jgi:hypothetical protein